MMTKKTYIYFYLCAVLLLAAGADCHAQRYPERRFIRQGNKEYVKGDWVESEVDYRRALEKTPDSYEARFNLGNSLYKQERYEEAEQIFSALGRDTTRSQYLSESFYNSGNAFFQQRKLEEALEAYKEALRKNPDDQEAKFNLAYVKKLLDQNQDDNNDGDGNNDQDNNDDQNQDQDQNQDNDDKGDGDNDKDQDSGQQPPPENRQNPSGMTRDEAERMLEAMQQSEDKTREKMDKEKAKVVEKSEKNW